MKDNKEKRNRKIVDLWLACYSQEEIAEACNVTKETVSEVVNVRQKQYQDTESDKATASHAVDFEPPIYNIWKQQEKSQHVIAEQVGCSQQHVGKVRSELATSCKLPTPSHTIGKDGKRRPATRARQVKEVAAPTYAYA